MPKKTHTIVVGPFLVNCYLYWDTTTRQGVIIDPGADEEAIIFQLEQFDIEPRAILLTHGHGDHIAAVAPLKEQYDIPLYIGNGEEGLLSNPSANISAFFDKPIIAPAPDFSVTDEQVISVAGLRLVVLATPGHTPAGVCYLAEEDGLLFCGDTLFAGSVGRTDFPGSSHVQLLESIHTKILSLPDSIVCLPGHGPETTVGAERNSNPFLSGGQYA